MRSGAPASGTYQARAEILDDGQERAEALSRLRSAIEQISEPDDAPVVLDAEQFLSARSRSS